MIDIASAYEGYKFYLPVFLDFRGRISRSGILHFYERDLARSLIFFSDSSQKESDPYTSNNVIISLAFHMKAFSTYNDALAWYHENRDELFQGGILSTAAKAKHPFQFLSCLESK